MKRFKSYCLISLVIILAGIFSGCQSQSAGNEGDDTKGEKTVTIKIAYLFDGDIWEERVGSIEKDLTNIKLERIPYENTVESLQEIFAKGNKPDIIIGPIEPMKELEVIEPLDELIEQHNFDLDSLNPALMKNVRSLTDEGKIVGFPDNRPFFALYYNKDVFDLFGQPYPDEKTAMIWDEAINLAAKMTGEKNGTQYVGMTHGPFAGFGPGTWPLDELATNLTDPETGEVNIQDNPKLRKYFDLMAEYYSFQGIHDPDWEGDWFAEGKAAMFIAQDAYLDSVEDKSFLESLDMVPVPVWEDNPEAGPYRGFWSMVITNYSEHKDEAFKVLEAYVSKKHQLEVTESGVMGSILADPEIHRNYAINAPGLEGKNREAFFAQEPAIYEDTISQWDSYVDVGAAVEKIAEQDKDINTIIRELEEESAAKIKEAKEAGK
ncbi:extracellular solute-binding protein [Lederbergia sp. NSJ-179]|uniref:ABC transporter substrate-binding protein n=1 Tax=Lederbergia sp. NSJ-179 TaxID=2931402 RepID=UPI001FD5BF16|nr:extracellular solute-binding protein [Lederbergia sp. NSJ-179]MCJ7839852.1 extracellular solute-binding protein [Lederbergia sp. NSJ-179]